MKLREFAEVTVNMPCVLKTPAENVCDGKGGSICLLWGYTKDLMNCEWRSNEIIDIDYNNKNVIIVVKTKADYDRIKLRYLRDYINSFCNVRICDDDYKTLYLGSFTEMTNDERDNFLDMDCISIDAEDDYVVLVLDLEEEDA